jgi:hypothetical protein
LSSMEENMSFPIVFMLLATIICGAQSWILPPSKPHHFDPPQCSSHCTITSRKISLQLANIYDDWRSDAVVDTLPLDEDNVRMCLAEFVESDYGQQMFGCHDLPASYGITGSIDFVEIDGPEVILTLDGAFWHRRATVLGRAAMWLNARMPEITDVNVADPSELDDFEEIIDDMSGEVIFAKDKRSEDFNGDRGTMEYQGIDPDVRGPFPQGVGGLRPGGSMINPA